MVMIRDNNALREILRKPNTEASSFALCLARRRKAIANQPQEIGERKNANGVSGSAPNTMPQL